jgi:glutamate---cysteine ligase / carboxylate-amine ligase
VDLRTMGIEEELLPVDPESGVPRAVSGAVIRYARQHGGELPGRHTKDRLETEMQREQLETATRPCSRLDELDEQVRTTRLAAAKAARGVGVEVAALATSPLAVRPSLTPESRYQRMADEYARTADEQLTCGAMSTSTCTRPTRAWRCWTGSGRGCRRCRR